MTDKRPVFPQSIDCAPSPTQAAESALWGISHYFDADTRRFFKARVLRVFTDRDGQHLIAVESVLPPDGKRRYRAVMFDETGQVRRTEHESEGFAGWLTAAPAHREADQFASEANAAA